MNRILLSFLIFSISANLSADGFLEAGFLNPPSSAKARTWWHWIDGNVSKEGITADLEAMKHIGIQEAQIFNVGQGYPEGPATFMSPEWLDCFLFAVSEAERLGLEIGFHNGAGWSSSGGPWITPEYAMQKVVFSEVQYKGKTKIKEVLPQPPTKLGYYKDIAVLAFPTPKGKQKIDDLDLKTLADHSFKAHMYPDAKTISQSSLIRKKDIIDLTEKVSVDGSIEWTVPAGKWTILRIGHTPHGTENRPAGAGGRGLECDKLSREAVDVFWAGGIQPIIDKLGSLVGSSLTNCVIDSYEVGCNNWTSEFNDEFKQRRGYDCSIFLPALAGYYIESGEITERFLWDFRKTIGDLISDNYYAYFSELCHKNGMKFSIEPYGGPFDYMQSGSTGDIVMSEFWVANKIFSETHKLVASIAHLNGNTIVGAEAFTSTGGWLNHPADLKSIGDWIWTEGINRFIFHTYVHQPWNVAPGVTFHMYGLEMNRLNTWWGPGRTYMDYIARSQFLLQQGRNAADVLVFVGESSPNDGIFRPDIKSLGYDYDEIGMNKVMSLTVEGGWIQTPAGGIYRMMLLPETIYMTPKLLTKIEELVEAGALIVGQKPVKSPSLHGFPKSDKKVMGLANKLWNNKTTSKPVVKGEIPTAAFAAELLKEVALPPDFTAGVKGADLNFIHRIAGDADIYFIANFQKESRNEDCRFRVTGKRPRFWNPKTGEIEDVVVWKEELDKTTSIPIYFEPEGSIFIVFQKETNHQDHVVRLEVNLYPHKELALHGLKIISAEYGEFLLDGLVDVTEKVRSQIKEGNCSVFVNNSLSSFDPAPGSIKELRIEYEADGQLFQKQVVENTELAIESDAKKVKLLSAVYGKFPQTMKTIPPIYPITDVTRQITRMIESGNYLITVNDHLIADLLSANNTSKKELRMVYTTEDEIYEITAAEGREINLALDAPKPKLMQKDGKVTWLTPYPGKLKCTTSSGLVKEIQVSSVPEKIELTGEWEVSFPPNLGAPEKMIFDGLTSWPLSKDAGIRYFSGTATYKKKFILTEDYIQTDYSLELDLGNVKVMAEVFVNGKNLGVLWKNPFRISLEGCVHDGINELEIRVTNLWTNRLIGDEHLLDDCERGDWLPKNWPDWLVNNTERPSERTTFTTWKHWNKDSKLQASGLLGPVYLQPYVHVTIFE